MTSLAALCACSTTVTGSGSAAPTPTPTSQTASAPPYRPPKTAIGNPRTINLCSGISPGRFARFGDVSRAVPVTPVDCWFFVRPPGAKSDVRMSAYVYGASPYQPQDGEDQDPTRTVSGQLVYPFPFADRYCRAMIGALDVAIGVEADDHDGRLPGARVCAMRDTLIGQLAAAVAAHRLRHRTYGPTSLTAVEMCDHLNTGGFDFPESDGLELTNREYGNACGLTNAVYSIEIWVGLRPPPVRPEPGGKRLNLHGHEMIQPTNADSTYCAVIAQQDLVPGADFAETIEASAELAGGAVTSGIPSGAALCTEVAGPVLLQFLEATGRI